MISPNNLSDCQTNLAQMPANTDCEIEMNEPLTKKMMLEPNVTDSLLPYKCPADVANTPKFISESNTENVSKSSFENEFLDPVIFDRLKGTMKLKLQGSVTQAVKGLLSTIFLSMEEVENLRKLTEDLQKRIRKLEGISRKTAALIVESVNISCYFPSSIVCVCLILFNYLIFLPKQTSYLMHFY